MTIEEIRAILPHRYPFLLVDRVIKLTPGVSITALKNVTANEPFFVGHFPEQMVMPGVLMIEALAQTVGLLAAKSSDIPPTPADMFFLAGVDNARFRQMVVPGDQLILEAEVITMKRRIMKHKTRALANGKLACSADIMCAR